MDKINSKEFKELTFRMLQAFAHICEENNLRYILDYGTLLGAVRHHGFIPWDDDIDVTMPREDYEKFYTLMKKNPTCLGKFYRLAAYDNEYSVQKAYFNIIDIRTITYSPQRRKKYYYPVWLDIFPMDYLPEDADEAKKLHENCQQILFAAQSSYHPGYGKMKILRCIKNMYQIKNLNMRLKQLEELSKQTLAGDKLTNYVGPYATKDISSMEYYDRYIYMEFEGSKFRVSKNYDSRLKQLYGDYMVLPPENKRNSHVTEAYWK